MNRSLLITSCICLLATQCAAQYKPDIVDSYSPASHNDTVNFRYLPERLSHYVRGSISELLKKDTVTEIYEVGNNRYLYTLTMVDSHAVLHFYCWEFFFDNEVHLKGIDNKVVRRSESKKGIALFVPQYNCEHGYNNPHGPIKRKKELLEIQKEYGCGKLALSYPYRH